MKKRIKTLFLVLLCLILCISAVACGGEDIPEDALAVYKDSYTEEYLYSYWLSTYKYYFLTSYNEGMDTDEFWDGEAADGQTNEEYILNFVENEVKNRTIALELFDEYGLSLSEKQTKAIEDDIEEKLEYVGGRQAMNSELSKFGMNIDMLKEVFIINEKYDMVIDYLYGEGGKETPGEAERKAFYEDNYYCLKLITVYTDFTPTLDDEGNYVYDTNGEIQLTELSEEEKKQKAETIKAIDEKLSSGADFDECIKEYSEADYSNMPNGILLSSGDYTSYGADVVNTAKELEIGEYRILSDSVSTLVLQKCPLPGFDELTETELSMIDTLDSKLMTEKRNAKFEELYSEVTLDRAVIESYSIREVPRNSYYVF